MCAIQLDQVDPVGDRLHHVGRIREPYRPAVRQRRAGTFRQGSIRAVAGCACGDVQQRAIRAACVEIVLVVRVDRLDVCRAERGDALHDPVSYTHLDVYKRQAHALGDLLAHAFPDRIGKQHPQDPKRYQLANGRMLRLFDDSALYGEPWIVASELRFEAKDALLLRAAPVDEAYLRQAFAAHFHQGDEVRWDANKRALASERIERFDGIVLSSKSAGRVDPALAAQALTEAVRELGLEALPWSDALSQWRVRVQSLRAWMPELALPDLSDAALQATLDTCCLLYTSRCV